MKEHQVFAQWDAEAGVWVATSEDVPGLCAEAASLEELLTIVGELIPELMELNCDIQPDAEFPFHITAERSGIARAAA